MRNFIRSTSGGLPALEAVSGQDGAAQEALSDLRMLTGGWNALGERDAAGKASPEVTTRDALLLLPKILVAQRQVTDWLMGGIPSAPDWVIEDGHVVVGSIRVPLTVDMLEAAMKGQMP